MVTGIHDESHTQLYAVHTQVQGFQPSHVAQLEVVAVMVVAQIVAVGEEGFSGILCGSDTQFNAVVVVELVSEVVTVFVTQITVEITMAIVERNLERSHEQVFPIFRDVVHLRPYAAWTFFANRDIVGELLARLVV